MPSIVTHYLMGEEVTNNIDNDLKKAILNNYQEFAIGTNGPDLFFYYNAFPWMNQKAAKAVAHFGGIIHSEKINPFFKEVLSTSKDSDDDKIKSYVSGLLCHWALDKTAHPFIFHFSEAKDNKLSSYYHRLYESGIDALMLEIKKHKTIKDFKPQRIVAYDLDSIEAIYQTYVYALDRVYDISLDYEIVYKSMQHFYSIQKALNDPKGAKKKYGYQLESLFRHPYLATSMIIPNNDDDKFDLLNLNKAIWNHPVTNTGSNLNFIELYDQSIKVGSKVLNLYNDYLNDKIDIDEVLNFINNESFETGLSYLGEMKYFNCKYE